MSHFDAWEAWAAKLQPGDRCAVAGCAATVTAVQPNRVWARIDGQADAMPWDWEDVWPPRSTAFYDDLAGL